MSAWPILGIPLSRGPAITTEAWLAGDEDAEGELVDGHLEEEETADLVHELVVAWLVECFRVALRSRGLVVGSEVRYLLWAGRGRKPDVSAFLHRRVNLRGAVSVPPDIAVEAVTPTPKDERRDRIEKMDDYARFGIRWYWIVDPALVSVEVFELVDGRYSRVIAATGGAFRAPGLDVDVDVDALWAELRDVEGPATE